MNKNQLIDALSSRYGGNKRAARHALESVLDTITREVARGEKVAITGFGSFEKRVREARMVRNPRTGERIRAKKTAVPKFTAGQDLKNVVSGAKKLPKLSLDAASPAAERVAAAAGSTRKTTTKKTAAKKAGAAKSTAKKATAKKAGAAKSTAKKAAKKAPAKSAAKKTTKKASAAKTTAKKATAKKAPAKKSTANKAPARKAAAKKAPAKKSTAKKAPAKKTAKKATKRTAKKS